jgi:hypothetical protein
VKLTTICRYGVALNKHGHSKRFVVRIPLRARDSMFSIAVKTGPGAHSASFLMGTGVLTQEVKRPNRGVDHPPPSSTEVKNE